MQDAITNILNLIAGFLSRDPLCDNWLSTLAFSGIDLINSLVQNNSYGYGDFYNGNTQNYITSAFSGNRNADGTPTGVFPSMAFTINAAGAFYNATALGGRLTVGTANYKGGTPQAQAAIVIHELAHIAGAAGFNQNDAGNATAVGSNDGLVNQNCGKLINSIGSTRGNR